MYIYSLECYISYGDESVFSVQNSTSNPKLSTKVKLDYENTTQYSVVVVAQDLANECHKGRALVQINIVDLNDNYPTFNEDKYTARIPEDAPSGTLVTKVLLTLELFCPVRKQFPVTELYFGC